MSTPSLFHFFFCPPFPFTFKRHSNQHTGHLESLLVFLAAAQTTAGGGSGGRGGGGRGRLRWDVFAKQMEKHHCVALASGHTDFPLAVISRPAPTFIHSLQSGLMCQSRSTSFKKKRQKKKKQMLPEHSIKRHTKHYSMVMSSHPWQGRSRTLQVRPLQLNDTEM